MLVPFWGTVIVIIGRSKIAQGFAWATASSLGDLDYRVGQVCSVCSVFVMFCVFCFRYVLRGLCVLFSVCFEWSVFCFHYVLRGLWAILKHLINPGLVGFWAWELSMPDTFSSSLWSSTKGGQLWSPTLNNFDSKLFSWVNSVSDWKIVGVSVTFSLLHYIPSLPVLITVITDTPFLVLS